MQALTNFIKAITLSFALIVIMLSVLFLITVFGLVLAATWFFILPFLVLIGIVLLVRFRKDIAADFKKYVEDRDRHELLDAAEKVREAMKPDYKRA